MPSKDLTITAQFSYILPPTPPEPVYNNVEITIQGDGGSAEGDGTYSKGSSVQLKATPSDGYVFVGWYLGDVLISGDMLITVTVSEDVRYTALFLPASAAEETTEDQEYPNTLMWVLLTAFAALACGAGYRKYSLMHR